MAKQPRDPDIQKKAWWGAEQTRAHAEVHATVSYLTKQNRGQREDARFFMELASNFNIAGNGCENYAWFGRAAGGKMRRNLTSSMCDTAASLILQNRTVPMAVTAAGDYKLSRRAERWTRAIQGQYYQLGVFQLTPDVGMDALQTGTGYILGYVETDDDGTNPRPVLERILPNELFVDAVDGQYRKPRTLYRLKLVSREQLCALYPKHAAKIRTAGGPSQYDWIDFVLSKDNRADFVRVIEAWHLPSGPNKRNGRHVICTDNCDLRDEVWTKDTFPIREYRYVERRMGFHGQGMVERVMPAQIRLSEIQQAKRDMQRLCSNTYWLVPQNSAVTWEDLTNLPGQQITYQGQQPPQMVRFEGTPQDLSAEEQLIVQEVMEQEGLANSITSGDTNKALSSARAIRAADDVASRRHVMPTRLYEDLYLGLAELISELNDECSEIDPEYSVTGRYRSGQRTWIKTDKWTDIRLPKDNVQINVFPISALPTTPTGLWSTLEEMTQAGMIGKSMALDLQQMPDIDAFDTFANASYDFTRWHIDRMFDGESPLPVEYQDLAETPILVQQALLVAIRLGAPPDIVANFERYLSYCKSLEDAANPPVPAMAAPAALNPMAAAALAAQGGGAPMPGGPMPAPGAPPMSMPVAA